MEKRGRSINMQKAVNKQLLKFSWGLGCRDVSNAVRPLWGKRQITNVSDDGLGRETHVYRSLFSLLWPCWPRSMGKRLHQTNLLESKEDKAAPQSPAFSNWGTEKQKVHVISPYFTPQVTPLPQLPPFAEIYPSPALDGHFIWPCPLVSPATSWHWTSRALVSSYTQLLLALLYFIAFPTWFLSQTKAETKK